MDSTIVSLEGEFAPEEARKWEGDVFQKVCAQGRREAETYLGSLEEALFAERPAEWEGVGFRERTLVTRFGEVRIGRRLYRDERGAYHFLLDEYLGLNAHEVATPDMQAMCAALGGEMSFRAAARVLARCMAGLLSVSTCWRLVQRTGEAAITAEEAEVEALFGRGEAIPEVGKRQVDRLYVEADGVYVRLQGQPRTHLELRSAIAYEGWERLPETREGYRLVEKRVYCHGSEHMAFWEGVSLAWSRKWALSAIEEVIIGGDGAKWIRDGVEEFPGAVWQPDGFHLARACSRAYGAQRGRTLYHALRAGEATDSQTHAPPLEGKAGAPRLPMGDAGHPRGLGSRLACTAGCHR